MIIGIGIDRTDMRAVENNIHAFKIRLTPDEIRYCNNKEGIPCIARRHAAKEAIIKALGVNDALGNVDYRHIEISNTSSGRPVVSLTKSAKDQLNAITPPGHRTKVHISITDDVPAAEAVCIIEAIPLS